MLDTRFRCALAVIFLIVPSSACSGQAPSTECARPGDCPDEHETGAYVPAWKTAREKQSAPPKMSKSTGTSSQALTAAPSGSVTMRPEWSPLAGTVLRWPVGWSELKTTYLAMLPHLQSQGKVEIVVSGANARTEAEQDIRSCRECSLANIEWVTARTGSVWMRDYGPLSIYYDSPRRVGLLDLDYYHNRVADDAFPATYASRRGFESFEPDVSLEGGNFQTDGQGNCFLSVDAAEENGESYVRSRLNRYFGCQRVYFLDYLVEEGTHHLDMWLKLVSPTTVLVGDYSYNGNERLSYPDSENDGILDGVATEMEALGYTVIRLPQPKSIAYSDGSYTIRSYTNSSFANKVVLVPVYGEAADRMALSVYARALAQDVRAVPIDASYVIEYGGAMHCITMERFPER